MRLEPRGQEPRRAPEPEKTAPMRPAAAPAVDSGIGKHREHHRNVRNQILGFASAVMAQEWDDGGGGGGAKLKQRKKVVAVWWCFWQNSHGLSIGE